MTLVTHKKERHSEEDNVASLYWCGSKTKEKKRYYDK